MKSPLKFLLPVLGLAVVAACGESLEEGEDYGDLFQSPEGLVLTEEEHEIGWGRSDCTTCHNLERIHLLNRSTLPLDIDAIHDRALDEGEEGCPACHGENGVP